MNSKQPTWQSTKVIELGSCAFRQWRATHSHCQYIHGYQLKAKFYFAGKELDDKNWMVDFGGIKALKSKLNDQFDHTLCVAQDDPLLPFWQELNNQRGCQLRIMEAVGIEKTAEWCYNMANDFIKLETSGRCWVDMVEVFEHENNSAIYFE
jgi:6-pyruvoyltetrahydropterin/6-carboxytetrahydropterin synthase